jgi:hypothetical protein
MCEAWESDKVYEPKFCENIRCSVKNRINLLQEKGISKNEKIILEFSLNFKQTVSKSLSKDILINSIECFNFE